MGHIPCRVSTFATRAMKFVVLSAPRTRLSATTAPTVSSMCLQPVSSPRNTSTFFFIEPACKLGRDKNQGKICTCHTIGPSYLFLKRGCLLGVCFINHYHAPSTTFCSRSAFIILTIVIGAQGTASSVLYARAPCQSCQRIQMRE